MLLTSISLGIDEGWAYIMVLDCSKIMLNNYAGGSTILVGIDWPIWISMRALTWQIVSLYFVHPLKISPIWPGLEMVAVCLSKFHKESNTWALPHDFQQFRKATHFQPDYGVYIWVPKQQCPPHAFKLWMDCSPDCINAYFMIMRQSIIVMLHAQFFFCEDKRVPAIVLFQFEWEFQRRIVFIASWSCLFHHVCFCLRFVENKLPCSVIRHKKCAC